MPSEKNVERARVLMIKLHAATELGQRTEMIAEALDQAEIEGAVVRLPEPPVVIGVAVGRGDDVMVTYMVGRDGRVSRL